MSADQTLESLTMEEVKDGVTGYCLAGGNESVNLMYSIFDDHDSDREHCAPIVRKASIESLTSTNLVKLQRRFRALPITPLFADQQGRTYEISRVMFQLGTENVEAREVNEDIVVVDAEEPEYVTVFLQHPNVNNEENFETTNKATFVKRATLAIGQSSLY